MSEILRVENLNFQYDKLKVLNNVSFSLEKGDFLGIIGENGTGKTTLMKLILGLLPYESGKIYLFGKERKEMHDTSRIGYVSQKANSFNSDFPATVQEVIAANLYSKVGLFKRPSKDDKNRITEVLNEVGMDGYEKRLVGRMSGGQQQRIFIARTLVSKPELMLLDEPTVGVDAKSVDSITKIITGLNKKNVTIIMTNHDTEALKSVANKLLFLSEDGSAELRVRR